MTRTRRLLLRQSDEVGIGEGQRWGRTHGKGSGARERVAGEWRRWGRQALPV